MNLQQPGLTGTSSPPSPPLPCCLQLSDNINRPLFLALSHVFSLLFFFLPVTSFNSTCTSEQQPLMLDVTTTQEKLLYRLQPELLQTHFKPPAGQGAPLLTFPFIRGLQGTVLSRLFTLLCMQPCWHILSGATFYIGGCHPVTKHEISGGG